MEKAKNVAGVFELEIKGKKRDLKCTFGAIEALENKCFDRPILSVLNDALNGNIFFLHVVDVVLEGLKSNKDTRFSKEEIGQEILEKGLDEYVEIFIRFLTYAVSGEKSLNVTVEPVKKK